MVSLIQHFEADLESQPQNSKFRNNPENFHPCRYQNFMFWPIYLYCYLVYNGSRERNVSVVECLTRD